MKVKAFRKKPEDGKGWYYYIQAFTQRYMVILEWDFVLSRMWKIPRREKKTVDKGDYLVWDYVRYGWLFFTIAFARRHIYTVSAYHAVQFTDGDVKGSTINFNKCLHPAEVSAEEVTRLVKETMQQSYDKEIEKIVAITAEQYDKNFGNMPSEHNFKITKTKVKPITK